MSASSEDGGKAALSNALAQIEAAVAVGRTTPDALAAAPAAKARRDDALNAGVHWPSNYIMTPDGFTYTPIGDDAAPIFLCGRFAILGRCRDEMSGAWGLALEFVDFDGVDKTLIIAMADLVGDAAGVLRNLVAAGLEIGARKSARDRLIEAFIAVRVDGRVLIVYTTGWTADFMRFVLPNRTIGSGERTAIAGTPSIAKIGPAGTLDAWRDTVAAAAAPHPHLIFGLALAFASSLLGLTGAEGCVFHWLARSSTGKTTLMRLFCSVWGPPGFAGSWRGTSNGHEGTASLYSDVGLALDELGIADARSVGDTVYMLVNGGGKSRMRSDGALRPVATWRLFVMSAGEVSLEAKLAEDGSRRTLVGGQTVRFVALKVGSSILSAVTTGESAEATIKALKSAVVANHGTAGPAFLERLVADQPAATAFVRSAVERFVEAKVPRGADGQVARVAAKFALVAAAGELAARWGILPFKPGTCETAAGRLFTNWLIDRGGDGSTEDAQAIARVKEFLQAHASARLPLIGDAADRISSSFRVQMLAGYQDRDWFYLNDGAMREALGGLDPAAASDALHRAGYLAKGDKGRRKVFVSTPAGRERLYNIAKTIMEHDDGS